MGLPRTLTHDPELDIDWGIHKVTEPVTGPVIGSVGGEMAQYYGRCRGGPYNAKQMTHGAAVYRIAFDKNNPLRGLPGQQASTVDVEALFGNYVFDQERCEWNWDETSISESRETA